VVLGDTRSAGLPPTAPRWIAGTTIALVVALAAAGLGLGLHAILAPAGAHPSVVREAPAPGAWDARASFGPVVAERIERSVAQTFDAHHGSTAARSDRIVVSVRLRNRLVHAVPFSPGEFRLEALGPRTTVTAIEPVGGPASIEAATTLRTEVAFLVPLAYRRFALTFDDALAARRIRIPIGAVPAPATTPGSAGRGR
jgi:hypothetical protein